jgi:hypothetical protein
MSETHNRLIREKSPYLLQHAGNPVDWYPWGEQAFEKAVKENKPVFLSIGYSTCHWCHVMAHESFEDVEVARLMNETFVSIKVDREERPDIDGVYMTVCQMMTGSGGWPLTIVMTSERKPFFAATYIPKESRYGRMGMLELVPTLARVWTEKKDEIKRVSEEAVAAVRDQQRVSTGSLSSGPRGILDETVLTNARKGLYRSFDEQFGGFGNAPKFPTVSHLLFLLRYWKKTGDEGALHMVKKTLTSMRIGGIYDHIGFGFHRYSTDQNWLVPHFEKMLYDQALLLLAFTEAWQATGEKEYADTALEVAEYVCSSLTSPEGGFYCAEDADSEGEEGRFYLWEMAELERALTEEELDLAKKLFSLERNGNYFDEVVRDRNGKNIIHLKEPLDEAAKAHRMTPDELGARIGMLRQKLFTRRETRIHPHKDDKVLTDWNGLMIAALAAVARILGDERCLAAAQRACAFILENLRGGDGRLFHRYRDGERAVPGTLDDYAFLTWGLLELYETTFDGSYLERALEFTDILISHFWDGEAGGLFFTADDSEEVLLRRKDLYDGAVPSGNSVALLSLFKLGRMTGEAVLLESCEKLLRTWSDTVKRAPIGHTFFLLAADFQVGTSYEIVVVGKKEEEDTRAMLDSIRSHYIPCKVVILKDPDEDQNGQTGSVGTVSGLGSKNAILPPRVSRHVRENGMIGGKATCYVCTNYECMPPMTDVEQMLAALKLTTVGPHPAAAASSYQ